MGLAVSAQAKEGPGKAGQAGHLNPSLLTACAIQGTPPLLEGAASCVFPTAEPPSPPPRPAPGPGPGKLPACFQWPGLLSAACTHTLYSFTRYLGLLSSLKMELVNFFFHSVSCFV